MADSKPPEPGAKHPGDRLASYFENFFRIVTAVATLGASITFAKIVQTPVNPFRNYGFSEVEIQYLIASSWLFFVLALGFTSFFASALTLWRPQAVKAFGLTTGSERRKVLWYATAVSAFLFALVVVAFILISLVVVSYTGPVGWVAVVFTVIFGITGFGTIIWQSPLEWPNWLIKFEREEQDALERHIGLHVPTRKRGHDDIDDDDLASLPRYGSLQQQQPQQQRRQQQQQLEKDESGFGHPQQSTRKDGGYDYGRSTSGDYGAGGTTWRSTKRDDGYDLNRYSRASTVISDAHEPGRFGQGGFIYDDGVREGLVMSRYAS